MENQKNSSTPPTQSNSDIPWQILLQSEYAIREGDEFLGAINANNFEGRHTHNYEGMAVSVPPLPTVDAGPAKAGPAYVPPKKTYHKGKIYRNTITANNFEGEHTHNYGDQAKNDNPPPSYSAAYDNKLGPSGVITVETSVASIPLDHAPNGAGNISLTKSVSGMIYLDEATCDFCELSLRQQEDVVVLNDHSQKLVEIGLKATEFLERYLPTEERWKVVGWDDLISITRNEMLILKRKGLNVVIQ